jgi:hypothetical protein
MQFGFRSTTTSTSRQRKWASFSITKLSKSDLTKRRRWLEPPGSAMRLENEFFQKSSKGEKLQSEFNETLGHVTYKDW